MRGIPFAVAVIVITGIILMPALGYTNQAAGNQSYSAISGPKINYSIESGVPAHSLTPEMIRNKYSFQAQAVGSTRMPYSFQLGDAMPYSFKVLGVGSATGLGMATKKETALLGSIAKQETIRSVVEPQFAAEAPAVVAEPAPPADSGKPPKSGISPVGPADSDKPDKKMDPS